MPGAPACRARGFTLTECCVATAIVAVIAALAAPSFREGVARRELVGRAAELTSDLQWLRTEAVARQEAVALSLQHGPDGDCYVMHTVPEADCRCGDDASPPVCEAPAVALKSVRLPAGGAVRLAARPSRVTFHPERGNAASMAGFTLHDAGQRAIVLKVSQLGRVRACASGPALGGHPPC